MSVHGIAKHLPEQGLIAITWAGVGLAGIFVTVRTFIRFYKFQRLRGDDYFIYAAFIVLVVNAILQTFQTPGVYYMAKAEAGRVPEDEVLVQKGARYLKLEFTIIGLFWTVLWLVKASFLAFFYHLFDGLPVYRKIWWGVMVFCFFAYSGCWIASINNCHPAADYFALGGCIQILLHATFSINADGKTTGKCNKPVDLRGSVIAISYSTTVDILTDVMIMAMPLNLLWKVKISRKEKMGLAAVFSICFIIIIFAIIRAVQITFTARNDAVLLALWGILESSICRYPRQYPKPIQFVLIAILPAVVVGCLPPFKSLFAHLRAPTNVYSSGGVYGSKTKATDSRVRQNSMPLQLFSSTTKIKSSRLQWDDPRSESREGIVETYNESSNSIFVKRDV
ncbi:hypothetical protein D0Z07_9041, partial [Hyphodiscus hymeniophilus]